ncbi:MAG: T9SS type A sorting domain-containing protein [Bacteroidales bacterium]|nr:T9SS type A sorting domain-containing protein [Bacteroidales bacterium]
MEIKFTSTSSNHAKLIKYINNIVVLVCFWLLPFEIVAQDVPHVLFIGNSYTEANNLPDMVQQVARSAGKDITYASNTPGGCTFSMHCNNNSMNLIRQGGWDVIVLQEQSQLPSFPQNQVETQCLPFAKCLADSAIAYNPDVKVMFYMTWGRKNGDDGNAPYFPVLGTYEGMDSMLCLRYMQMKEDNDAFVCPVGRVWRQIRFLHPEIELYDADGSHPSPAGSYAAACAFYAMIFAPWHATMPTLPEEITADSIALSAAHTVDNVTYTADLDKHTAFLVREIVDAVVFDSLYVWQKRMSVIDGMNEAEEKHWSGVLYPTPANNMLFVDINTPAEISTSLTANIADVQGRIYQTVSMQAGHNAVNISSLPQGTYFLLLPDKAFKFVKKR